MKAEITTLVTGSSGVVAVEAVPHLAGADLTQAGGIIQIVVQIVIGIATLLGLFGKNKTVKIKN